MDQRGSWQGGGKSLVLDVLGLFSNAARGRVGRSGVRQVGSRDTSYLVCVPAFADDARSWRPLLESIDSLVPEGEVVGLVAVTPATIAGYAAYIAEIVERELPRPIALVGHSLGSAIAVEAAHLLGPRCAGLVSIEGNLTPEDAYHSGKAADYDDPHEFHRALTLEVQELVAAGRAPATYAEAVAAANAADIWTLGRDARALGAELGLRYRGLTCPTLYLWCASTTPPETADYLARHHIPARQLPVEHHWPWQVDPGMVANAIAEFLADLPEGGHSALGLPEGP